MDRPLRIAMFVGCFPEVSETFILRQITGLLDLGHQVDIYADTRAEPDAPLHPEVLKYRLLERTTYMDMPPESTPWELPVWPITGRTWLPGSETSVPNWRRALRALPPWLRCAANSPRLAIEALQPSAYGFRAASLSPVYRLARLCAVRRRYDVLHAHFGPVANNFRFARSLWQAPLIATFHGYDFCVVPREQGRDVYRALFRIADAVTVNCGYTGERVAELGCPADRVCPLHVGIDVAQFAFQDRRRQPGDTFRLISVGRLVQKKGIEFAIRAVAQIGEKIRHLQYDIIGDGPLRPALRKLTSDLGLQSRVFLHGARDSQFVQRRLVEAHCFVLPSITADNGDQEGTPVALMEAQATGLPVLSTRHAGIPEVVPDGQSGFLLLERDVPGLADKLLFLLEHPEVCRQMGQCGRQQVENQFDIRRLNQDLVGIYGRTRRRFESEGAQGYRAH